MHTGKIPKNRPDSKNEPSYPHDSGKFQKPVKQKIKKICTLCTPPSNTNIYLLYKIGRLKVDKIHRFVKS